MEDFFARNLPWIVTLFVTLVSGGYKLSREFAKLEASLSSKMGKVECEGVRKGCVASIKQEVRDIRETVEEERKRTEQSREAFARAEGNLSKAVEILEEAVREIKRANGHNKKVRDS